MNLADEIRKQIEKNKGLKLAVGEINNHLSTLENLVRKDIMEQVDEAYQRGLEDGKAQSDRGCEGCRYSGTPQGDSPCFDCSNYYNSNWTAQDDKIEVGDEVVGTAGHRGIVTKPINSESVYVMWEDGSCGANDLMDLKKTGRTRYDIEKLLEAMKA